MLAPTERTVNVKDRTVKHSVHVFEIPITVEVDRVRSVDRLETMLQSARGGPHLREHSVAVLPSLLVHDVHQALGKTGHGDNGATTRWRGHLEVVTSGVETEDPVGPTGIEDGVESDEIGFFANSPLEIVLIVWHGRSSVRRRGSETIMLESWRTPDRVLAVLTSLMLDHISEVLVAAVQLGHPKSFGSLPHSLARLFASPVTDSSVEFVVVSVVAKIHFPVPVVIVIRELLTEPLKSKVSRTVDTVNTLLRGVLEWLGERRRVVVEQLSFRPENSHVPELLGHILFNDLLVHTLVGPNGKSFILDMQKEVDVIFTTRLERELSNHGTKRVELVVVEIVASPDAKDIGMAGDLGVGVLVLETCFVLVVALLHSLAPVDVGVVDCAHLLEQLVGANILRVETRTKTTGGSVVAVTVRTKSAISIVTDIVSNTKLFVGTEEGSRHVSGKAGVDVDIRHFDLVLIVHITRLDFSMLLSVFVRVVIGIRIHLDGFKSWLLGKAASFVAVNDAIWHGAVVAVLRCPVIGRCQSADTVVIGFESVASR